MEQAGISAPHPATLVPSEPVVQPEKPAPDAGRSAWIEYHHAMADWLEWQEDVERWRKESDERQKELAARQESLEQRQDGLESRMEGVEELSRLFVEVTQRLGPETLTPEHQASVKQLATRLHDLAGYPYGVIYSDLNAHFHVGKYSDIPDDAWERVREWFQQRLDAAERRRSR
ncbi:MAG TPA: hypothetical protein VKQ36_12490 [Ktedonobacterales bacterium]|nr:hypothetical protein [Ktedonobacterales bacterium]